MATSKIKCCGPCLEKEHLEIPGIVWCRDCGDFLCKECNTLHATVSATSHHIMISLQYYLEFPQFTLPLINQCQQHEKKYEYYCTFHGIQCCVKCIQSNHKQCTNLKPLDDVIKNIKSSVAVSDIERDVKDLSEIFTVAEKSIDGNIISLATEEEMFLDEVRDMRKAINKELDKMERSLNNEFYTHYQNEHEKLSNLLKFIKSKRDVISQLQNEIDIMKKVATDLQVFTSIQTLEQNVHREITQFMEWKDDNDIREVHLKFNKSEMYSRLPDAKDFFGFITVDEAPAGIQLPSVIKDAVAPVTSPPLLVVGVDISSYSCCAFSTRRDYKENNIKMKCWWWFSRNIPGQHFQVPSCVLLDRNKNLISFGYRAEKQFSNAIRDNSEHQYIYFKNVLKAITEVCKDIYASETVDTIKSFHYRDVHNHALKLVLDNIFTSKLANAILVTSKHCLALFR